MSSIFSRRLCRSNVQANHAECSARPIEMLENRVLMSVSVGLLAGPERQQSQPFPLRQRFKPPAPLRSCLSATEEIKPLTTDPDNGFKRIAGRKHHLRRLRHRDATGITYVTPPGSGRRPARSTLTNSSTGNTIKSTFSPFSSSCLYP